MSSLEYPEYINKYLVSDIGSVLHTTDLYQI